MIANTKKEGEVKEEEEKGEEEGEEKKKKKNTLHYMTVSPSGQISPREAVVRDALQWLDKNKAQIHWKVFRPNLFPSTMKEQQGAGLIIWILRMFKTQQESQNWELLAEPLGTKELTRLQLSFKIPWQEQTHAGDHKLKAQVKEKGLGYQQHARRTGDKTNGH